MENHIKWFHLLKSSPTNHHHIPCTHTAHQEKRYRSSYLFKYCWLLAVIFFKVLKKQWMIESMNVCLRLNSLGKEWYSFLFKFQPFFFHIPYLAKEMQLAAKMNAMQGAIQENTWRQRLPPPPIPSHHVTLFYYNSSNGIIIIPSLGLLLFWHKTNGKRGWGKFSRKKCSLCPLYFVCIMVL